jgi:hypothetical protein
MTKNQKLFCIVVVLCGALGAGVFTYRYNKGHPDDRASPPCVIGAILGGIASAMLLGIGFSFWESE